MSIYIYKNNLQSGPFEENIVIELLKNGQLSPDDLGFRQGQPNWQPLKVLFPYVGSPSATANYSANTNQFSGQANQYSTPNNQFTAPNNQFSTPNQFNAPNQYSGAVNQNSGGSKTLIFVLLGIGGLLLVGTIGAVGIYLLANKPKTTVVTTNVNSVTNIPSTPAPNPVSDQVKMRNLFESKKTEFTTPPTKVQLTTSPYLKGKLAYYSYDVKYGEKTSYWLLGNSIPVLTTGTDLKLKDLYAQTPEEVQTIVLRKCQQIKIGNYQIYRKNSGIVEKTVPGYNQQCEITLIDSTIPAVIFRKKFEGKLKNDEAATGSEEKFEAYIPYFEIVDFITGLPRK